MSRPAACRALKNLLDPLELKLWVLMSSYMMLRAQPLSFARAASAFIPLAISLAPNAIWFYHDSISFLFYIFFCFVLFVCFETGVLCVALAVLELIL